MLAMVLSRTTISWATQIRTSAHAACLGAAAGASSTIRSSSSVSSVIRFSLWVGAAVRPVSDQRTAPAAGRMIWSMTLTTSSWVGASPTRKKRCSTIPARAGAMQLDVEVCTDLAALLGALEERLGAGQLGGEHLGAERLGELGVAADRGQDGAEGVDLGLVGQAAVSAEGGDQVAAQGAGVDRSVLGVVVLLVVVVQGVDDQLDLAVPAAVEGRLGRLGPAGPPRPW